MAKRTRKIRGEFQLDDVRKYMARVEATAGLGPKAAKKILKDYGSGARDVNNLHPRWCPAVARALIDALDNFDRGEKLRRENPWQLSAHHPRFVEATDALIAAWRDARNRSTRDEASEYMQRWLERYKDAGGTGSGARSELYAKLDERFSGGHG